MNYSHNIREAPMRMMNPSVMVSRLDLVVLEMSDHVNSLPLQRTGICASKISNKSEITFMDKNIDLIINSKFIGSQEHTTKRVTSNRSPRDHCIENQKRERGSHLATNYGPVGLQ